MPEPLSGPQHVEHNFDRVAILFSGGPAPAANAVISTAAISFIRNGIEVVGVLNGYSNLMEYGENRPLVEDEDYVMLTPKRMRRTRNAQGIIIGTARANPGKLIKGREDMSDPDKTAPLKTVDAALRSIGVDALISIGGDDTLKTANKIKLFQEQTYAPEERIRVVHLPKTIDNDYSGIDFTFGYFTAVEVIAGEIRNLLADAEANNSYFVAETMGRSAGWLAYGAAIAGEASLVISVEDITGPYEDSEEVTDPETQKTTIRRIMNLNAVIDRIVAMMQVREETEGKKYGCIVLAEGLAELMPYEALKDARRDEFGHIAVADIDLGRRFAKLISTAYQKKTGRTRKLTGVQLGYECRCARPQAFDVMLGSQLGVGAYRALVEENLDGVMVSVERQFELHYVDFEQLVDPATLVTVVRFIEPNSHFHQLARFLETYMNK